jgi:hypothetical protein
VVVVHAQLTLLYKTVYAKFFRLAKSDH